MGALFLRWMRSILLLTLTDCIASGSEMFIVWNFLSLSLSLEVAILMGLPFGIFSPMAPMSTFAPSLSYTSTSTVMVKRWRFLADSG